MTKALSPNARTTGFQRRTAILAGREQPSLPNIKKIAGQTLGSPKYQISQGAALFAHLESDHTHSRPDGAIRRFGKTKDFISYARTTENERAALRDSRMPASQVNPEKIQLRLTNLSDAHLRYCSDDYGIYAEDHPVAAYVGSLFTNMLKENEKQSYRVVVTRGWNEENAFALANGVVVISDRMLSFLEYKEELQFVLRHELNHLRREHSLAHSVDDQEMEEFDIDDADQANHQLAQSRLHEYESDLRAFMEDEQPEFNPYGGIVFMERLTKIEKRSRDGLNTTHGRSMDRLINLHYSTHLIDLSTLSRELTAIPAEIIGHLQPTDSWAQRVIAGYNANFELHVLQEQERKVMSCPLSVLTVQMPKLYQRWRMQKDHLEKMTKKAAVTESEKIMFAALNDYMVQAVKRLENEFNSRMKEMPIPRDQRCVYRGAFLALVCGVPVHEFCDEDSPFSNSHDFLDFIETADDLDVVVEVLKKLPIFGFKLTANPGNFLREIVNHAAEIGVFDDDGEFDLENFCARARALSESLVESYEQMGAQVLNLSQVYSSVLAQALLNIRPALFIPTIQSLLRQPNVNRRDFVEALTTHVDLKPKQMQALQAELKQDFGANENAALINEIFGLITGVTQLKFHTIAGAVNEKLDRLRLDSPDDFIVLVTESIKGYYNRDNLHLIDYFWSMPSVCSAERTYLKNCTPFVSVLTHFKMIRYILEHIDCGAAFGECEILAGLEFDQLRELHDMCRGNPEVLGERMVKHFENKFEEMDYWYYRQYYFYVDEQLQKLPRDEFFETLNRLQSVKPKTFESFKNVLIKEDYDTSLKLAEAILQKYAFDDSPQQIDQLISLCELLRDHELADKILQIALGKLFGKISNAELKELLFQDERLKPYPLADIRQRFIDECLVDPAEIDSTVKDLLARGVEMPHGDFVNIGKVIFGSEIASSILDHPLDLLDAILVPDSDKKLKQVLWRATNEYACELDISDLELPNLEMTLERLYQLSESARYALLRQLLLGPNGVLLSPKLAKKFIRDMLNDHVAAVQTEVEREMYAALDLALQSLVEVADPIMLYFLIEPFLRERILRRASQVTPWEDIVRNSEYVQELQSHAQVSRAEALRRVVGAVMGTTQNERGAARRKLFELTKPYSGNGEEKNIERVSVVGLILNIASRMMSAGVRFLQVIGQYIELPPELEEEFSKVYDAAPGQSKLTAFLTAKREWHELPGQVTHFGRQIGGGSQATVYETTVDSHEEVLKVLQPNVEYHLEVICNLLQGVFERMRKHYPGAIELALVALNDIREWIGNDLNDSGFLVRDAKFRVIHNDVPVTESYRMAVPRTFGTESRFYKREEKVPGRNLTQADQLVIEGHNLKEITQGLIMDLKLQFLTGVLHSDFHPGNVRITPDRCIAILDRSYFIELDDHDRAFFARVQSEGLFGLLTGFTAYLSELPQNADKEEKISKILASQMEHVQTASPAQLLTKALTALKSQKIHVPLKVTLIVKNLMSLDKFARKAGYANGLIEAMGD